MGKRCVDVYKPRDSTTAGQINFVSEATVHFLIFPPIAEIIWNGTSIASGSTVVISIVVVAAAAAGTRSVERDQKTDIDEHHPVD